MIKFENTVVSGWEAAIRGCRNPMNSWHLSDSGYKCPYIKNEERVCSGCTENMCIGPADMKMMTHLIKAGTDEAKFMRYIDVTVDITAPLYWWKEFDTYKIGTVANSCSTMHKIHEKEFTLEDFSTEHLINGTSKINLCGTIELMNQYRRQFVNTKDKEYWWQMIQLLPSSYNQRRTVKLNYQVLRAMYFARRNHKLDEWRDGFCEWVEGLPYSELITMNGKYEDLVEKYAELKVENDSLKECNKNLNEECDRLRDMLAEEHNENIAIREQLTEIYDEYLSAGVDKEFGDI